MSSSTINFVLSEFESEVTLGTLASLYSENIPTITADAKAVQYVSISDIKNVFKYQTDSNDVTNLDSTDLKYYTYDTEWPVLNPANAMVEAASAVATSAPSGAIAPNKLFVAHDFTRHLADELFGTHLGVDLFNNELELLTNIREICGSGAAGNTWFDITASVKKVSVNSDADGFAGLDGDSGAKYMTNANTSSANLCRVLMSQMIGSAPSRFAEISAADTPQSLPFAVGDIISFKVNIKPAEGQKLLTKSAEAADVKDRSYEIKLEIVADDEAVKVNLAVADDEAAPPA